jgi:hypothetical protein
LQELLGRALASVLWQPALKVSVQQDVVVGLATVKMASWLALVRLAVLEQRLEQYAGRSTTDR